MGESRRVEQLEIALSIMVLMLFMLFQRIEHRFLRQRLEVLQVEWDEICKKMDGQLEKFKLWVLGYRCGCMRT